MKRANPDEAIRHPWITEGIVTRPDTESKLEEASFSLTRNDV